MTIIDYNEYVCMFNYSDGYANYKRGEVITIERIGIGGGDNPRPWVYPVSGHPIMLEAFKFCFIWRGDWGGNEAEEG
tara:strand:- start:15129 stop:15359 length:231 start_codon:yes stop_codon:yes gene_type:complete